MNTQNVSKLIADIRSKNYLTLKALGGRLGVSAMTIFNWQKGKVRPSFTNLIKLKDSFPEEFTQAGINDTKDQVVS